MKLNDLNLKIILDSRQEETIEVNLSAADGFEAKASIPSGKSKSSKEAFTLEPKKVAEIFPQLQSALKNKVFIDLYDLANFLNQLDPDKNNFGSNLHLAIEIAWLRLESLAATEPLYRLINHYLNLTELKIPKFLFNLINGGAHVKAGLTFQEYLAIPLKSTAAANLKEAFNLIERISLKYHLNVFGDEGGFAFQSIDPRYGLEVLSSVLRDETKLGLDLAANYFCLDQKYTFNNKTMTAVEMTNYYAALLKDFPIIYMEDPLCEDDLLGWQRVCYEFFEKIMVVGDDLTSTKAELIVKFAERCLNAVIIKTTQAGGLLETFAAIEAARKNNLKIIISHRSGETMDDFIADLAVGVGADFLKAGSPIQKERLAKYERVIAIEKELA
ncbi:hypothetical protein M1525_01110 [Patescibacteria group bacterium]|nr:hypothetical protein [Patescibacteria group bacterium]